MSVQRFTPPLSHSLIEPIVWERIRYSHQIKKAVAYLEEHLTERTSERAVAAAACLEQTAFSRAFKRTIGLTFREFAEALRISRAIDEMLQSDQSLTHIAHVAGFMSLTNLERAFRRRLGVSPSTYRKALLIERGVSTEAEPLDRAKGA
jgi:AraC-like DNA-binding protein